MTGMRRLNQALIVTHPDVKRQAIDWCNQHGINPDSVPLYAQLEVIDDDYVEIEVYDMTSYGQHQWDEETQRPKLRWLRVKTKSPFPEEALEL